MARQQHDFSSSAILRAARLYGTPLYLYDASILEGNVERIYGSVDYRPATLHFALMSNANLHLLRFMRHLGVGVHVSSPGELAVALRSGFRAAEIVVTGCNFSSKEMECFVRAGCVINVDSLGQLEKCVRIKGLKETGLRLNSRMRLPRGTINAAVGVRSRMGIDKEDVAAARTLAERNGVRISGLQMYIGTNMLSPKYFLRELDELVSVGWEMPDLSYVDLGGGFGIPYADSQVRFPWPLFGREVSRRLAAFSARKGARVALKMEPGRNLIGDAAVMVATVTDIKRRNGTVFVGCNASLSNFPRPYIYKQFHRIRFIYSGKARTQCRNVVLCGNSVAANDILSAPTGNIRAPREGDLVAISDVGAYGLSMSSHFCGRLRPAEVMVEGASMRLIRRREDVEVLWRDQET